MDTRNVAVPASWPPVAEVMTPDVVGIVPDAPLEVALRLMVTAGVKHLPVITAQRCVGLLHETDVLWRLWTHGEAADEVGVVCRAGAPAVDVGADLATVAAALAEADTDAAVVSDRRRVVGIVTASDVVRYVASDSGRRAQSCPTEDSAPGRLLRRR